MDADPLTSPLLLVLVQANISIGTLVFMVLILVFLLFLSALLAGSEVAFFSLNSEQRLALREDQHPRDQTIAHLLDRPQKLLATLLIAINLINILFIGLANYLTEVFLGPQGMEEWVATVILLFGVTFVITFFGELIPKVWAQQNNLTFVRITAPLISFFSLIFAPFSRLLLALSHWIESKIEKKGVTLTNQELNQALDMTTGEETSEREKDILKGILNFGNTSVKGAMTARRDILAFDLEMNFHELLDKVNKNGYSRVPVFKETIDQIKGILYIKDLIQHIDEEEDFQWQNLLHQPFFVPENKKIDDLLYDFQEKRVHMAVVVNEYGETEGLITMEDIIEEILGEINDEYDVEAKDVKQLGPNSYLCEAKMFINDLAKLFELETEYFAEARGDSETLGGMLLECFGRIPKASESIVIKDFEFKIQSVDSKRIKKVKITLQTPPASA